MSVPVYLSIGATTYADYVRRIPPNNQYKLDKKVDFEHHGVDRDLHEIAKNMKNWDGDIAPPLGLTPVEISDIQESIRKPQMQRSVLYIIANGTSGFHKK